MPESPLTTGVDALIEAVNERRALSFDEAASIVKVPVRTIEAWASFLEEEGLLRVEYRLTKPFLVATSAAKAAAPLRGVQPRVTVRQLERPQRIQRERPVLGQGDMAAEAPSAEVDSLLDEARDALAAGDSQRAKEIYTQLQERYKQFPKRIKGEREAMISTLAQLNAALLEESGTDKESEAAAKIVRESLVQVQQLCKKGARDAALEEFMKAHTAFESVKATELRLSLTPLMSRAQQALLETERVAASKDWTAQLARVQALLDQLDKAIAKQDTAAAFVLYEQIEEAKKAIPSLVSERKTDIERRVLPIYERLLSLHLSLAKRELEQKLDMLGAIERKIDEAIAAGKANEASRLYEQARRAYLSIPDEFFERKIEEQKTLLSYSSRIADLELRTTAADVRSRLGQIDGQIQQALIALGKGDVLKAQALYNDIVGHFSGLPGGFGEDKLAVQKRIVSLYEQLLRASRGRIAPPVAIPDNLIEEGLHLFGQAVTEGAWSRAISIADRIGQLHVPSGQEESMALLRQKAGVLRDAASLDDIADAGMLGAALRDLHASYAAIKGVAEPGLLAHVKDCYLSGLKRMSALAARRPARAAPREAPMFEPAAPAEERVVRIALPKEVSEPIELPTPTSSSMPQTRVAVAAKKPTTVKPVLVAKPLPVAASTPAAKPILAKKPAPAVKPAPAPVKKPAPVVAPTPAPAPKPAPHITLPTKRGPLEIAPRETPAERWMPPEDDFAPRHDLIIAPAIEREGAEKGADINAHYRLPEGHIDMPMPVPGFFDSPETQATPAHDETEHVPSPFDEVPALPPVPRPPAPLPPALKTPHVLTPPRKMSPEQLEDAWREGMTLWHESIDKEKWLEAQHIAELLLRLGEPPKKLEAKAMGVVRQAELLRRGHSLANISDLDTLRIELSGFYAQYSETLRAYPREPLLYAHLKAVYVGSMGALNAATMNAAARNAAAMNAARGA